MRIKKGDIVVVIAGKDKGKQGEVLNISSAGRLLVKGVNVITKHIKKTAESAGERLEKEAFFNASNVMIVDGEGNASRVQYSFDKKGKKERKFQTTGKKVSENFTKA